MNDQFKALIALKTILENGGGNSLHNLVAELDKAFEEFQEKKFELASFEDIADHFDVLVDTMTKIKSDLTKKNDATQTDMQKVDEIESKMEKLREYIYEAADIESALEDLLDMNEDEQNVQEIEETMDSLIVMQDKIVEVV